MEKKLNALEQQQFFAELNENIKKEIREQLTSFPFPIDEVTDFEFRLKRVANKILKNSSLNRLKADLEVYKQLSNDNFNLFSVSYLLNVAQDMSAKELEITTGEYIQLIEEFYEYGKIYNKYATPIKEAIQGKYQKIADKYQNEALVDQNQKRKVDNKKVIPLNRE